ncbi:hypothetical protein B0H17DRAFT_1134731 [Mycena rosella]|uniref:Uncharacterized protein n=1 Tax=Mycena rosella TaxID=1033263 RepID=A0AAD7GDV4_MYCRO|nr:hypothetical protein B0H17DRAFT_1134731 [Mycena rosella]
MFLSNSPFTDRLDTNYVLPDGEMDQLRLNFCDSPIAECILPRRALVTAHHRGVSAKKVWGCAESSMLSCPSSSVSRCHRSMAQCFRNCDNGRCASTPPLSTRGEYIYVVGTNSNRFKLKGGNWHGASGFLGHCQPAVQGPHAALYDAIIKALTDRSTEMSGGTNSRMSTPGSVTGCLWSTATRGMFSCGNHHDQTVSGNDLAPPAPTSTFQPLEAWLPCQDNLSAHCLHLETLLDSALATLALIRDTATPTAPATLSPHTKDVLWALFWHTLEHTDRTTPSLNSPTQAPQHPPSTKPTTYAAACTATDRPGLPEPIPVSPSPTASALESSPQLATRPDMIFRFDLQPPELLRTCPHPSVMFDALPPVLAGS